jgi:hypothetical protein
MSEDYSLNEFNKIQHICGGYAEAIDIAFNRAKKPIDKFKLKKIVESYKDELITKDEIPFPIFEIGPNFGIRIKVKAADYLFLPGKGVIANLFNHFDAIILAKRFGKVGWYYSDPNEKEGYILEFEDFIKELKKIEEEVKDDERSYKIIKCWIEHILNI